TSLHSGAREDLRRRQRIRGADLADRARRDPYPPWPAKAVRSIRRHGVCPQRRAVRQARLHARHILGHAGGLHRIDRRHPAGAGTVYALCGGGRRHLHDRGREIHLGQGLFLVARRVGISAADRPLRGVLSDSRRRGLGWGRGRGGGGGMLGGAGGRGEMVGEGGGGGGGGVFFQIFLGGGAPPPRRPSDFPQKEGGGPPPVERSLREAAIRSRQHVF